jgi:hypothetical protein
MIILRVYQKYKTIFYSTVTCAYLFVANRDGFEPPSQGFGDLHVAVTTPEALLSSSHTMNYKNATYLVM